MAYGTVVEIEGVRARCVAPGVFEALDGYGMPSGRYVYPKKTFIGA